MALQPSSRLGPYEVIALLGAGGQGEVYRARDIRLEREVAIKVLPERLSSDPSLKQRLEREAKAISKLSHPHICALYDIGYQDGAVFLVMELVEGETLDNRLRKGPLPPELTIRLAAQIAAGLGTAHKLGIVHRDLKPGNVMLTKNGAKLMDFGLAKHFEPEPAASVLTAYGEACAAAGVKPATVLLSFAPVADYEDIEFLVWLGATITPETEDALLDHRNRETGIASLDVARSIWARIRNAMARAKNPVPLGVNIEEISVHNFDLAVRMAQEFPAWRGAT